MRLSITRENILGPLQIIAGVVEKRQTMPVLSNVLLVASETSLTLTGTNMEVELVCDIGDVDIAEAGQITVPARKFSDICRSLPDGSDILLELSGEKLHLVSGNSSFTLTTLPAEHFPNIEEDQNELVVSFVQKEFKHILDATAFAMAQQDVRYYLNGLLLEFGSGYARAVATDGHRLATSAVDSDLDLDTPKQAIIPRKGVLELMRLLADSEETVELNVSQNHVRSKIGNFTFTSKLIEGKFPDYNRVIPRGGDKIVIADRQALKSTFTRASILSNENIRGIRLNLENSKLQVFANNPEHEQAEDSVEVMYSGESLQIGFNVSYLIDVMNVISDESVKLTLSNANASVLIESESHSGDLYVVMPMRL